MSLTSPTTPTIPSFQLSTPSAQLKIALARFARGLTGKYVRVHIVEGKDFLGRDVYNFFLVPPDNEARTQLIGAKGNNIRAMGLLLRAVRLRLARECRQALPLVGKITVL